MATFSSLNSLCDPKETLLVSHVKECIENAQNGISQIPKEILDLPSMTSQKIRLFLNYICKFPNTHYLEIGPWCGATFTAALYNNEDYVVDAIAIDNWSDSKETNPKNNFMINANMYLTFGTFKLYEENAFTINKAALNLKGPINIYFYDGDKSQTSSEQAFTYFDDIFDNIFIAIINDWNWEMTQDGTKEAFRKLKYNILYEIHLPATHICDTKNWWDGLYVAVIKKTEKS